MLGQSFSARVLRRATQQQRVDREPSADEGEPGPVAPEHREELEGLLDLVRVAIELEGLCDYNDRANGAHTNRRSFVAHFGELERPLEQWDETVERVAAAPGALWGWFARSAASHGITEPPFTVGPLIDRLAILTAQRARQGLLGAPHALHLQQFADRAAGGERVSLYVEGQNVAQLPSSPATAVGTQIEQASTAIQALFDEAQASSEASEIEQARDLLLDLKQPLLDLLTLQGSHDTIHRAAGCPVCEREDEDEPEGPASS